MHCLDQGLQPSIGIEPYLHRKGSRYRNRIIWPRSPENRTQNVHRLSQTISHCLDLLHPRSLHPSIRIHLHLRYKFLLLRHHRCYSNGIIVMELVMEASPRGGPL
jgi:hypothetical protein